MKIGLLSDTHSHWDPRFETYFQSCDEIWHAGDIGSEEVLHKLQEIKPVKAVYGNIDGAELRIQTKSYIVEDIEGLRFLMLHIAGTPPRFNETSKKLLMRHRPNVIICGHSHLCKVTKDPDWPGLLYINPGAAGHHGFHTIKTMMRFDVQEGRVLNMEVIELGKRGQLGS